MLRYELVINTDEYVSYRYYPEGEALFGTVTIRKHDKEIIAQEIAPEDDFKWYFWKIVRRVEDFIDAGDFPERGIVAWY